MRKGVVFTIILLTVLALIAGAFLPAIAAWVLDTGGAKVSTAPMQSMELEVSEDEPQSSNEVREPADLTAKLMLAGRMYTVPITEDAAVMTRQEVLEAAEQAMAEYIDAGVFEWFNVTDTNAEPVLGLDAENPEEYMTFWSLYYANEEAPYQVLRLYIDDETGRVLYIKYEKYGSFSMDGIWERNRAVLDTVTTVFFRQAGLSEVKEYADSMGVGVEVMETDGGVTCMRYSMGDVTYGELTIEFYATGTGAFEVYFPAQ